MIPDPLAMIPMPRVPQRRPERREARLPPARSADASLAASDRLRWVWRDAQAEAKLAYAAWCREGGANAYAVYRASQSRADAAQDAFARSASRRESR
jgi:hypothetical protein